MDTKQSDKQYLLSKRFDTNYKVIHANGSVAKNGSVIKDKLSELNNEVNNSDAKEELQISRLSKTRKITLLLLCMANVCAGCSFSMLAPFFPQEAERKGMSEAVTGFVFSSFQIVCFVSALLYGNFMIHIGPKFLFVCGILVAGACSFLFGFLDKSPPGITFILLAFACRSFEAVSVSAFVTASFAIVAMEFPQHVSTVFAGGFGLPFFVIGSLILLIGCIVVILLPKPQGIPQKRGNILSFLRSALVWEAMQSVFTVMIGISFLEPIFATYLEEFNLSPSLTGLMFVIVPGLYGLTTPLWGYLADKRDKKEAMIIAGSFASGVAFLFVGPTPLLPFLPVQLWINILGLIIFGASFGLGFIAPIRCLFSGASNLGFEQNLDTFGSISGLFNAAVYLGAFTGPSLGGVLAEAFGFRWATTFLSGICFLSSLCSFIFFLQRYLIRRWKNDGIQQQSDKTELTIATVKPLTAESETVVLQ